MKSSEKSIDSMYEFNQILEEYEDVFGELPPIPKCGSYATIASLMKEALIAKTPLVWEDVIDEFQDIKVDLI